MFFFISQLYYIYDQGQGRVGQKSYRAAILNPDESEYLFKYRKL